MSTSQWKETINNIIIPFHEHEIKGPARKDTCKIRSIRTDYEYDIFIDDDVQSIRCLSWPPDASEWVTRRREHGWPDKRTIQQVVDAGCHIVAVAHDECSNDPLQWRISFSKAEVILMKSLTKGQQYVFNLLRFFTKRELIQEECRKSDQVLNMYIIKTFMMWQCELKSAEWWRYPRNQSRHAGVF